MVGGEEKKLSSTRNEMGDREAGQMTFNYLVTGAEGGSGVNLSQFNLISPHRLTVLNYSSNKYKQ